MVKQGNKSLFNLNTYPFADLASFVVVVVAWLSPDLT